MARGHFVPSQITRLAGWIKATQPDLVQTWMYHANLIGGITTRLACKAPVIWNVQNSDFHPVTTKTTTILTIRACATASWILPARIISCSHVARTFHERLGHDQHKFVVIPNGVDLDIFHPDPASRNALRNELKLPSTVPLIGMAARYDPQKDHQNFLQAAAILHRIRPDVHFVLCGNDIDPTNITLARMIEANKLRGVVHLLGRRDDMPQVLGAFDIAGLSSAYGEAFPLTLIEAMACGIPCVVTNVGDSAEIVGNTGRIVPPRDPLALAAAWDNLLTLGLEGRAALGIQARKRICELCSINSVVKNYQDLYTSVIKPC